MQKKKDQNVKVHRVPFSVCIPPSLSISFANYEGDEGGCAKHKRISDRCGLEFNFSSKHQAKEDSFCQTRKADADPFSKMNLLELSYVDCLYATCLVEILIEA